MIMHSILRDVEILDMSPNALIKANGIPVCDSKKVTKAACWISFLFSSVLMILNIFFRPSFPAIMQSPINCGAIAMLAGLVIVPIVSLFTPKPDQALVDESFACYENETVVAQTTALGD